MNADLNPAVRRMNTPKLSSRLMLAAGIWLGVAAVASLAFEGGVSRLLHAYLINIVFLTSLSLGALFFVILQHLTQSEWSVVLRRIAESLSAILPWLLLLFVPVLLSLLAGDARLYPWNDADLRNSDSLIRDKAGYLNAPFFSLRTVGYFAVWTVLSRFFWKQSLRQDTEPSLAPTLAMRKWSGPAMMLFALTVCFAAFDWMMSLDPHWFSSIFGIYFFSGAVVGFVAVLTIAASVLEARGPLGGVVSVERFHDLGKLLFGFLFFWAYIAFSQYLLIWYANIPEETVWFAARQTGGWQWVSVFLVAGHFVAPFLGLMSRAVKRNRTLVVAWAAWLLLMHWIDIYWLVMPHLSPNDALVGVIDALVLVAAALFYVSLFARVTHSQLLIPVGDPRLSQSLNFHNT